MLHKALEGAVYFRCHLILQIRLWWIVHELHKVKLDIKCSGFTVSYLPASFILEILVWHGNIVDCVICIEFV